MTSGPPHPEWLCITSPCYANPILRSVYGAAGAPRTAAIPLPRYGQQNVVSAVPRVSNVVALASFGGNRANATAVAAPSDPVAREAAIINPARPVIRATSAERDQFYRDRASILARYPNYAPGAASDPVFVITDTPTQMAVVLEAKPPPLLGVVGSTQPGAVRSPVTPTRTAQSNGRSRESGGQSMGWLDQAFAFGGSFINAQQPSIYENLGRLGGATSGTLAGVVGEIAGQYFGAQAAAPSATLPPYVNPTTRVSTTSIPNQPTGAYPVGCISQRDIDIAAAAGTSPEMVDLILKLGRRNKRRRRMLTKSDIGDISTMRQILGGGEAFKLWLAKATRS